MKKKIFVFTVFMLFVVVCTYAQSSNEVVTTANKIKVLVTGAFKVIAVTAGAIMISIHGFRYMTKPAEGRGDEDTKKLVSNMIKIAVGCALIFGAASLANMFDFGTV